MVRRSPTGSRKQTGAWKGWSGSSRAFLGCSRCCEWATGPRARGNGVQGEDLGQQCLDEQSQKGLGAGGTAGPRGTAPGDARDSERR